MYVIVPEGVEASYAKLSYDKEGVEPVIIPLDKDASYYDAKNNEFKLTYANIPAKEMTVDVTVEIFDEYDRQMNLTHYTNGPIEGNAYSYCIADWANNQLAKANATEATKTLAKSILNYGDMAQKYFNFNVENPANPNGYLATEMEAVVANHDLDRVAPTTGTKGYNGTSLNLEGATEIFHYFDKEVVTEVTDAKGNALELKDMGSEYRLVIPNIASKNLDDLYTVNVTTADGETYQIVYAALSWANLQLPKTDVKVVNLAKALYLYNDAAKVYFKK